jgi:hypothetical protein
MALVFRSDPNRLYFVGSDCLRVHKILKSIHPHPLIRKGEHHYTTSYRMIKGPELHHAQQFNRLNTKFNKS